MKQFRFLYLATALTLGIAQATNNAMPSTQGTSEKTDISKLIFRGLFNTPKWCEEYTMASCDTTDLQPHAYVKYAALNRGGIEALDGERHYRIIVPEQEDSTCVNKIEGGVHWMNIVIKKRALQLSIASQIAVRDEAHIQQFEAGYRLSDGTTHCTESRTYHSGNDMIRFYRCTTAISSYEDFLAKLQQFSA